MVMIQAHEYPVWYSFAFATLTMHRSYLILHQKKLPWVLNINNYVFYGILTEERRISQIKESLKNAYTHDLYKVNKEEDKFWKDLIKACLKPNSNAFGQLAELKSKCLNCDWLKCVLPVDIV